MGEATKIIGGYLRSKLLDPDLWPRHECDDEGGHILATLTAAGVKP